MTALLPPGVKVHLALGFIDMRKGIDGLASNSMPSRQPSAARPPTPGERHGASGRCRSSPR